MNVKADRITLVATARASTAALVGPCLGFLLGSLLGLLVATNVCLAGVLSQTDLKKVEDLRPMFATLMGDLVQTSKRTDISAVDADCVKSTIQNLVEISQELSSFEYLITIEKELTNVSENDPTRDVVKFAVEQSTNILTSQRKKIAQLPDQCMRLPLALAKSQQALQVVDATTGILSSIRSRL
ncbi:hypothetical protein G8O24_14965 [Bradyrhizobium sp. INPA01-394B]|uniref:Uncharacterized protein n=2 Tax=Bradyrhizobium campsiandrae TaxID=1729892 RepID=A0ABR7UAM5_9BRAD|nr:hypothetical protein [Bradyrhizobium campsiandrae]MBC9980631.1 hypothetical protein [Bradyrhizobium campsiandrae]